MVPDTPAEKSTPTSAQRTRTSRGGDPAPPKELAAPTSQSPGRLIMVRTRISWAGRAGSAAAEESFTRHASNRKDESIATLPCAGVGRPAWTRMPKPMWVGAGGGTAGDAALVPSAEAQGEIRVNKLPASAPPSARAGLSPVSVALPPAKLKSPAGYAAGVGKLPAVALGM